MFKIKFIILFALSFVCFKFCYGQSSMDKYHINDKDDFDLSTVEIHKPKKKTKNGSIKLISQKFNQVVEYSFKNYNLYFDKNLVIQFQDNLKQYELFSKFNFDSLQKITLAKRNDTIVFKKYAESFNYQYIYQLIDKLIRFKKIHIINKNNNSIVSHIKYFNWSKRYEGCIHSGIVALINDEYLYSETRSYGRLLN